MKTDFKFLDGRYFRPAVERIDIAVERGFAVSDEEETGGTLNGLDYDNSYEDDGFEY